MSAIIMDGKSVSDNIKDISKRLIELEGITPVLAIISIGDNESSNIYIKRTIKDCKECGIKDYLYYFSYESKTEDIVNRINMLNNDDTISGIICHFPMPDHIDSKLICNTISPIKDVDCVRDSNIGKVFLGENCTFYPCTPLGVLYLLDSYRINVEGKNCVILGRSNIAGKPMVTMLINRGATVTICNSKTDDISKFTKNADIVISAVGKEKLITEKMVKEGSIVIDIGINRSSDGRICGDVDFDNVRNKASYITPVPGGIGLTTRAILMRSTTLAALKIKENNKYGKYLY